jgi:hypothetical protein
MRLQDVWADIYNAATVQRQHYGPLVCHRYSAK